VFACTVELDARITNSRRDYLEQTTPRQRKCFLDLISRNTGSRGCG
jgi:hypothetical protein